MRSLDALRGELALAEARLAVAPDSLDAKSAYRWARTRLEAAETIERNLLASEARKARLRAQIDPQGIFSPL